MRKKRFITVVVLKNVFQWMIDSTCCRSKPRFIPYCRKIFCNFIITFLMLTK